MNVQFIISDDRYFVDIVDNDTFGRFVLFCSGKTHLTIGDRLYYDDADIVIRVAEILSFLDSVTNGEFKDGDIMGFMFKFEQPLAARKIGNIIDILDYEGNSSVIESITVEQANDIKNDLLEFINTRIASLSPFCASKILDRKVL